MNNCENCEHIGKGDRLKCTGGYVPKYGWCHPLRENNCPKYTPKTKQ